ncbi:hypothetical protein [Acrocarpospora phusangensis]|nr:hypothetical protein [Acrocarpospora phusangensis]
MTGTMMQSPASTLPRRFTPEAGLDIEFMLFLPVVQAAPSERAVSRIGETPSGWQGVLQRG